MSDHHPQLTAPQIRPLSRHPPTGQRVTTIRQRHFTGKSTPNVLQYVVDFKYGVGLNHLPSGRFGANAAWLALNVIAHNMARWTSRIGGLDTTEADDPTAPARPARQSFIATDTLRRRHLCIPGRITTSARKLTLHLPTHWPWADAFNQMLTNLHSVVLVT